MLCSGSSSSVSGPNYSFRTQHEPDFLEKKYFELLGLESKHTQSICDARSEY